MDIPLLPGGKRTLAALAFGAASLWALIRFGEKPAPPPLPPPPAAAAPAAVEAAVPAPPKLSARKQTASAKKLRVSPLQDKGEALGGTPP